MHGGVALFAASRLPFQWSGQQECRPLKLPSSQVTRANAPETLEVRTCVVVVVGYGGDNINVCVNGGEGRGRERGSRGEGTRPEEVGSQ